MNELEREAFRYALDSCPFCIDEEKYEPPLTWRTFLRHPRLPKGRDLFGEHLYLFFATVDGKFHIHWDSPTRQEYWAAIQEERRDPHRTPPVDGCLVDLHIGGLFPDWTHRRSRRCSQIHEPSSDRKWWVGHVASLREVCFFQFNDVLDGVPIVKRSKICSSTFPLAVMVWISNNHGSLLNFAAIPDPEQLPINSLGRDVAAVVHYLKKSRDHRTSKVGAHARELLETALEKTVRYGGRVEWEEQAPEALALLETRREQDLAYRARLQKRTKEPEQQ